MKLGAPQSWRERWAEPVGRCEVSGAVPVPGWGAPGWREPRGNGGSSGGPWAVVGESSGPAFARTREYTRGLRWVYASRERERGKGYQLPFKQQKNPTDKESQTRSGAPSALPLSPVETAASQSQSLVTARGFLSPQHAGLVAIAQKKSAKTCAPPCSPSPARSQ